MQTPLTGISSKATAALLAELSRDYEAKHGRAVSIESVGGVDAAKRVAAGEAFDVVILEGAQIAKQIAAGRVVAGSERAMVHSKAMVAVRAGATRPPVKTLKDFQAALLAARAVGYSTGPSGVILLKMIEDWGLKDQLAARMVQAPPGKPVGALLAEDAVDIGIQQYSELMNVAGVDILGPLPPGAEINSVFTASVCAASEQAEEARRLVEYFASPGIAEIKRRQGFEPA